MTDQRRLLLIDDDELSREILLVLLEEAGYAVVAAASGEDGLALLEEGTEAVLTDLQMPGLCGAALAVAVRAAAPASLRTVLAMSASVPTDEVLAGYDGFLQKPFRVEDLAAMLAGVGREEPGSDKRPAEVLDETRVARLQASMRPEQVRELFSFALDDATRQAERMREAAEAGDEQLYRRCAHAVKGSFGMLGAPEVQTLAAQMEMGELRDVAAAVTALRLFLSALERLRLTLVARGICP